jgi:hypothetical protein
VGGAHPTCKVWLPPRYFNFRHSSSL